jgi:hypothetical protein
MKRMKVSRGGGIPAESLGGVGDVAPGPGVEDVWWKPGWGDVVRAVGWHWILVAPALAGLGLCGAALFHPRYVGAFWWLGLKGVVWALAIPVALLADVVRRVTSAGTDPFCVHCGYALTGLPERGMCPECGSAYSRALIEDYRRDPKWFIARYKMQKNLPPREKGSLPPPVFTGKRKRSRDGT